MINNNEIFRKKFNEIDDYLRKITNTPRKMGLYHAIKKAAEINNIVNNYEEYLLNINDLRNVIIHEKTDTFVADVRDDTIQLMSNIYEQLINPIKSLDFSKEVFLKCKMEDNLLNILSKMHDYSFSQIPIIDNTDIIGLLTLDTIARWFDTNINNLENSQICKISDVIKESEGLDEYMVMDSTSTIFDVINVFENSLKSSKSIKAVFIKRNRYESASAKIITIFDLFELYGAIKINVN